MKTGGVAPKDTRALVAVDLGAESCRVSLLRWHNGVPQIELVHRFANNPRMMDGGLHWDLTKIEAGLDDGLRRCAELAPEGIRSIAVDGWAVDYVHVDAEGQAIAAPFCYRDERTVQAEQEVHSLCSAKRMRELTGIQLSRINTLYQLYADRMAKHGEGAPWLNLPEYMLARWGGARVAELTNATHTQLVAIGQPEWCEEIFSATGLDRTAAPRIVPPGTNVGVLRGELAELPAFRNTALIAPACHDTASAIAGIPAMGDDWAYISSGTWSLVGTVLDKPCNQEAAQPENYTNLGAVGGKTLFHKNLNGMWLLRQCLDAWTEQGRPWDLEELIALSEKAVCPEGLLDIDDPELLLTGKMPERINAQRKTKGLALLEESDAPVFASLIFHSLAARYAEVLLRIEHFSGKRFTRIFIVGGGNQNRFLNRLTAEKTGLKVLLGATESSTIGNFAVQLATLEEGRADGASVEAVAQWAAVLARP